jgi:hypothetical protein
VFELPEKVAKLSAIDLAAALADHAFIPIDPDSALESSDGWVDWRRTSQPFTTDCTATNGAYSMLCLRCDQYKYDPATVEMMAEAYCVEQGYAQSYREMKGKLRQPVIDAIRAQLRAKTIPKVHFVEAAIDYAEQRIYVFGKASADIAAFSMAIMSTFGVEAQYLNYAYDCLRIGEDKCVPAEMMMMHLYRSAENRDGYTTPEDREIYCVNGDSIKMHGVAEGNLGNEYKVKTANETEDAIASNLIKNNAARPIEMRFRFDSDWGEVKFTAHADKLVPYGIDLPLGKEREEEEKIVERINMLAWLNIEWVTLLKAASQRIKDEQFGAEEKRDETKITFKMGDESVTMSGKEFDKAAKTILKGKGGKNTKK